MNKIYTIEQVLALYPTLSHAELPKRVAASLARHDQYRALNRNLFQNKNLIVAKSDLSQLHIFDVSDGRSVRCLPAARQRSRKMPSCARQRAACRPQQPNRGRALGSVSRGYLLRGTHKTHARATLPWTRAQCGLVWSAGTRTG